MRSRAAPLAAGALCAALLAAGASLGEAQASKPRKVCHHRHHRRVCRTVRVTPRRQVTTTTTTSTTSTSSETSTAPSTPTTVVQSTTTQTTSTNSSSAAPSLPHGTEVDERTTGRQSPFYAINAYQRTLAAGTIHLNIYNYDQDPHTLAVTDSSGQEVSDVAQVPAASIHTPVTLTVDLPPGTYDLVCTLPQHVALGMTTAIVVK